MVNRIFCLRISVMAFVFGFMVIGVLDAQTDSRLNGRWVAVLEGIETECRFNNGNFEESYNGVSFRRGTYTASNGELTVIPTHISGGGFNALFGTLGVDFGLESKWYSFNEFIITVRAALLRLGVSERDADEFVHSAVSADSTSAYSVDGNTLILTSVFEGERIVLVYNRR